MTTITWCNKEHVLRFLEGAIKYVEENAGEEAIMVLAIDKVGQWYTPNKKKDYYTACFGVCDVFKKKRNLSNILSVFDGKVASFAVFVIPKSKLEPKEKQEVVEA